MTGPSLPGCPGELRGAEAVAAGTSASDGHEAVVVAVLAVGVVQVATHEVVDVVAVGNRVVAARGVVEVAGVVFVARVLGRALLRMLVAHAHGVLLDRTVVGDVVEVTVVGVVDVTVVGDGSVAAVGAVDVGVVGVGHGVPFCSGERWST
jgi:hypothetical protein